MLIAAGVDDFPHFITFYYNIFHLMLHFLCNLLFVIGLPTVDDYSTVHLSNQ